MRCFSRYLQFSIALIAGLTLLSACGPLNPAPTAVATPAQESFGGKIQDTYPATPEEVVLTFLTVYPANPVDGIVYLSPALVATLSENTARDLLPKRAIPASFSLQQGSTNLESQSSVILAEINYNSEVFWIEFTLKVVEGRWVIDRIDRS